MARQVKRSGAKHPQKTSGHEDFKRPKNGRGQLRTVTRTARRPKFEEEVEENDEQATEESDSDAPLDSSALPELDRGMAYDALLTLLNADHKGSNSTRPSKKSTGEDKVKRDEEEEAIAGFEVDSDQESLAAAEVDENDEDVEELHDIEDDVVASMATDPFEIHFNNSSEEYIDSEAKLLEQSQKWTVTAKEQIPNSCYSSTTQSPPGEAIPMPTSLAPKTKLRDYGVKQRIVHAFEDKYPSPISLFDHCLAKPMFDYQDVSFPYIDHKHVLYRKLYAAHILNHVYKTRDRIIKNSAKIHAYRDAERTSTADAGEEPELRDQGFTRPKVLVLLPTREACNELVELLISLSGTEQQENKKKFSTQFHSPATPPESKPDDFRDTFNGNSNDFFCIGLKFTRKTLKLYSSFYTSDIIIASPIGISMILENPDKKKRQQDFISSIEVLLIDRAHAIEMQNWDHVNTVLKHINTVPKEFHDADFSRIRMWSINDQARLMRQTIVFGEYMTPTIGSVITRSQNLGGKVRFKAQTDSATCIMNSVGLRVKQIYQRFDSPSPSSDPDARFQFFTNVALPSLEKNTSYSDGILIYVPSYYDYLRVKNHMKSLTKITFASLDEYSSQSKVTRTRQLFMEGRIKMLLYTERLHHFRRFEISGVKTILLYGVPTNPLFYKDLVRFIAKSVFREQADLDLAFLKTIFSKWDALALERIVGADRAPILCTSANEMFEFR